MTSNTWFILAFAAAIAALAIGCEDGETKKDDCNTCVCRGGEWACTFMLCIGKKAEDSEVCISAGGTSRCFPVKRQEAGAATCTVGETQQVDYNTCYCAAAGDTTFWMCTLMGCIGKRESLVDAEGTCISAGGTLQCFPSKRQEEPECVPGETKKDDCNTCFCFGGGVWACTEMFCLKPHEILTLERRKNCIQAGNVRQCFEKRESSNSILPKCQNGKVFKIDCNWCICDGGEWLCTLKLCLAVPRAIAAEEEEKRAQSDTCQEGKFTPKGCNTCFCVGGEWMCTTRMCYAIGKRGEEKDTAAAAVENYERTICRDEDVKRRDCNVCVCMKGEWACTRRMCRAMGKREIEKKVEKEEEEGKEGEEVRSEKRKGFKVDCFGGEKKKEGCNRCVCLGGSWACTLNFC